MEDASGLFKTECVRTVSACAQSGAYLGCRALGPNSGESCMRFLTRQA